MEIVERRGQSAAVPLAVILSVLAALLIGLAAWNGAHRSMGTPAGAPSATFAASGLSPDAQERNADITDARLGKAETTHGH